jgi:hypothetical protein
VNEENHRPEVSVAGFFFREIEIERLPRLR